MNYVVFSFLIAFTLSFKSFNIISAPSANSEKQPVNKEIKAFSSDWETPSSWNKKYEGNLAAYYFERETPELNKSFLTGGTVAVFARGIKDDVYNTQNKPLGLPLYLFPVQENITGIIEYKFAPLHGKVQMVIQMQRDLETLFMDQKNNLQFRYFFLPDGLLKQQKIPKEQVRKLTYNQILEILQSAA